jgi:hypothetical protein
MVKRWLATRLVRVGMKRQLRLTRRAARHGENDDDTQTALRAYRRALALFDA